MANTFNGHRSWNAWNVALWINNDEGLYRLALECIAETKTRDKAAARFVRMVGGTGTRTPDNGRFNITAVKAAMVGM